MNDGGEAPREEDGGAALDEAERLEKERRDEEKAQRRELDKAFGNYGFIVMPSEAEAPILNLPIRTALHHWLFEMNAVPELKKVGLKPRTRALLSGPPGCGKTTLAHHIAARLGVPMVVVQSHHLLSKWVGQSGENIGKLFRAARRDPHGVALFFDEFDSVAKSREGLGGQAADNERANVTNALLQEMDRYEGLLFAATNVSDRVDKAIWRRFQMQIEIGLPAEEERLAIVRLYMRPFVCDEGLVRVFGEMFDGASPALIRECCETLKRYLVLGERMGLSMLLSDLLRRMLVTVSPPDSVDPPKLWGNASILIREAAEAPWPPALARK